MSYILENKDIVISGWEQGISDNPYEGIYDIRNCDTITVPGEVSVALSTESMQTQGVITAVAFTVDAGVSTSVFTYNGVVPLEINTAVIFTGADLPNGLTTATTAYYIKTTPTPTTFTVSEVSVAGAVKTFSDNGTGVMTFSTINVAIPKFFTSYVFDYFYRLYYMLDSNGRCWVLDTSTMGSTYKWVYMHNRVTENASVAGKSNGLQAYKGYLFWFESTALNVMRLVEPGGVPSLAYSSTVSNWEFSWKTVLTSTYTTVSHYTLVGQDNFLYFCNQTSVGSISEATNSLQPSNYVSFNIAETKQALDGVTTDHSATITTVANFFASTDVGAVIVGVGIPTGTVIVSVTDAKTAILSTAATVTDGAGVQFDITSSYRYNANALRLPSTDQAICLAELGVNLMVGGQNHFIYPWDRASPTFSFPIFLSENYISRMVTINTTCYIFCGVKGRIFVTNGANATPYYKIPDYLSKTTNPYFFWTDATFNRNQLYFGFTCKTNSGTTINEYGGLWAIDVNSGNPVSPRLENQMSYGTYAGYVSAIFQNREDDVTNTPAGEGYGLFIGWSSNGTLGGVDKGISTPYIAGQSYIDCDPLPVGSFLLKKTLENVQFKLSNPLVAGESVQLWYRLNMNEAYTIMPITQGGNTGDISGIAYNNFQDAQWIQIRVVLTSISSSPSFVRLREIRIH